VLVVLQPGGDVVPEDCEGLGGFRFEAGGEGGFFVFGAGVAAGW
jgi:hypothetical protein